MLSECQFVHLKAEENLDSKKLCALLRQGHTAEE